MSSHADPNERVGIGFDGDDATVAHVAVGAVTPADIFTLMYEYGYDFERVARHWHFRKVRRNGVVALKHRAILLVMRNGWLKRPPILVTA